MEYQSLQTRINANLVLVWSLRSYLSLIGSWDHSSISDRTFIVGVEISVACRMTTRQSSGGSMLTEDAVIPNRGFERGQISRRLQELRKKHVEIASTRRDATRLRARDNQTPTGAEGDRATNADRSVLATVSTPASCLRLRLTLRVDRRCRHTKSVNIPS